MPHGENINDYVHFELKRELDDMAEELMELHAELEGA